MKSPRSHQHQRATLCLSSTAKHQKQATSGVVDQNSGGNVIYVPPGLRLSYDKWSSYVSVGIPVISEQNGMPPEPSWRLISGVSLAF